tara:strand:- start:186 stop:356 length:171 start_codon:yes stop_codon:yes gene_type:complete
MATNPQGVQSHLGKPAKTSEREVVDSSYTYLYLITFSSNSALANSNKPVWGTCPGN